MQTVKLGSEISACGSHGCQNTLRWYFNHWNSLRSSGCLANVSSQECSKIQRKHIGKSNYFYINSLLSTHLRVRLAWEIVIRIIPRAIAIWWAGSFVLVHFTRETVWATQVLLGHYNATGLDLIAPWSTTLQDAYLSRLSLKPKNWLLNGFSNCYGTK